jgi:multiple sugar transport system ATP-binding protein
MASVRFEGVVKRFGAITVVDRLDLEVEDGEFLVVVGPSGCGKSTLLRLLAGLETPDEGRISIGGRVVNGVAPRDRDIAMVFQSYALYPHLTVRRNLAFGLEMRRVPGPEIAARVDRAARLLGLGELLDRRPGQLSGGQRQRVAVGRAIVREPSVFLFDEPLSNLDASLRVQMRSDLSALQRRLATTAVYVTHDQVEAMTMGDRVAVLDGGRLQQVAPPQEIYDRPANLFVARFIGTPTMNLLSGRLTADGGGLEIGATRLELPARIAASSRAQLGPPGRAFVLGFRPEAAALAPAAPAASGGGLAALPVEVEFLEHLGHETLVHARCGAERVTVKAVPRLAPAAGETVGVVVDPGAIHVFDPETSRRIEF